MTFTAYTIAFAAAFAAHRGLETGLDVAQLRHLARRADRVPKHLEGKVDLETVRRAVRYNAEKIRFGLVSRWFDGALVCLLVAIGFAAIYSVDLSRGAALIYTKKQLIAFGVGLIFLAVSSATAPTFFRNYAKWLYVLFLLLMAAVLFFGATIRGTRGWFDFGGFSDPFDIFEMMFGGSSPFGRQSRAPRYALQISFEEAVHGATKEVEIKKSSGISDANSKKTVDFTGIKDFKQPVQDSYHAATPAMNKLDTAAKDSTGKDVSHAYPANDLFYKTSAPIGQRIVRSLTTRRNSSHQGPLSSKVTLSTGQQHPELHDIQLPSDNLEIPQVHKISDDIRKPKAESLLIPQLVSDITQNIIGNKISMSRKPEATHDSTRAVNNTLDLVLTQSNRLPAAQHEGNYPQSDQSTQYTRRAQASLSVQSTQQTQASQASQPAVTQATVTKLPDENMNKNENQPDIRALAREIYPLIRRMIVVERERRPSR